MADNSNDIKYYKEELEKAIEDGVELFKYYKEISKDFQKRQKNLVNNTDLKNKINKIVERRKGISKRKLNKKLSESDIKLSNLLNAELAKEEELLKSNQYKQKHNKITEFSLVDSEKIFLKEKEKIRKEKKRILSRIKIALSQLKKKMFKNEFTDFIKYLKQEIYDVSTNKTITFKKLMNHLEAGEITEEAAKRTKKINDLKTLNNIDNRKSEIEYEIEKLKKEKKNSKKENEKMKLMKEKKNSKKENEKMKLMKKLLEIKQKIIKIYKAKFKGVNIPQKIDDIIQKLKKQSTFPDKLKEKIKVLEKTFNELVSEYKKL
jgi:hypothetical protein